MKDVAEKSEVWYLCNLDLLGELPVNELQWVSERLHEKRYSRGDQVYSPLKGHGMVYFIRSGLVRIYALSPQGKEITMDLLGPGDAFGELGEEERRETVAEVLEDAAICSLDRTDFKQLVERNRALCVRLAEHHDERQRKIEVRLEDIVFLDVESRILKLLASLAQRFGSRSGDRIDIEIQLTHKDIASLVASTRETTTSIMSKLKKNGIVETDRQHIAILKPDYLEEWLEPQA